MKLNFSSRLILIFFIIGCFVLQNNSFAQVNAAFTPSTTKGCAPLLVSFSNHSTGSPSTYLWNFGNGNTSAQSNPIVSFPNPGTYTVTLTASSGGSTSTATSVITIARPPKVQFAVSDTLGCFPLAVNFTDQTVVGSSPIATWQWVYGDGTPAGSLKNTSHNYTGVGSYNVGLFVTDNNGCNASLIEPHQIHVTTSNLEPLFTPSNTVNCTTPATITFQNNTAGSGTLTYSWTFGDGHSSQQLDPANTYTASGNYTVSLTVNNGNACVRTATKEVSLISHSNINFASTNLVQCTSDSVHFLNTTNPVPAGAIWYFGDGDTSTAIKPVHHYSTPGTYDVKLVVRYGPGCSDSLVKSNYITVQSTSSITVLADTVKSCKVPFNVHFSTSGLSLTSERWYFGDHTNPVTAINPNHTYLKAGSDTVQLSFVTAAGCKDSISLSNFINIIPPHAHISVTPNSGCAPLTVNAIDSSFSLEPIVSYAWNFRDTTTVGKSSNLATGNQANHVYSANGVWNPICTITNSYGCTATDSSVFITITPKPVIDFSATFAYPRSVCGLRPVEFTDNTPLASAWIWNFGDDSTSTNPKVKHSYADTGFFDVSLIVFNKGCSDTLTKKKFMHVLPSVPIFTPFSTCANPLQFYFENTSINSSFPGADKFYWNFGDSSAIDSTHYSLFHTFKKEGVYNSELRIMNSKNFCDDSVVVPIVVKRVNANFKISDPIGCPPFSPLLIAADSSAYAQNNYLFVWKTAGIISQKVDSVVTSGSTGQTTFSNPGYYSMRLVVTNDKGCMDSITKIDSIRVLPMYPHFNVVSTKGCDSLQLRVVDSSYAVSPILKWNWNFGDSTQLAGSPKDTATHYFTKTGYYNVRITTTNAQGTCTSPYQTVRFILPTPNDTILKTVNCPGELVTFKSLSAFANKVKWNFGDGGFSNDSITSHTFYTTKLTNVTLTAMDTITGCAVTRAFPISIVVQGPRISFKDTSISNGCSPYPVEFFDHTISPTPIVSRYWDFGDGNTTTLGPTDTIATNTYLSGGNYSVKLIVKNQGGCTDTLYTPNAVEVNGPGGSIKETTLATGCSPLTVNFHINLTNSKSYTLLLGDGNSLAGTVSGNIAYTYSTTTNQNFTPVLLIHDSAGVCNVQAPLVDTLKVYVAPKASFTWSPSIGTVGQPITFTDQSGQADTWNWIAGDSANDYVVSQIDGLTHTYKHGGTYNVKLIVSYKGCMSTVTNGVEIVDVLSLPNYFTPNGDGKNDTWNIDASGMNDVSVTIFDRWGREVFSSTNNKVAWDGKTSSGANLSEGTYYYVFTATSPVTGKGVAQKGFIELLR